MGESEVLSRVGDIDSLGELTPGWCSSNNTCDLRRSEGSYVPFFLLLGGGHTVDGGTSYLSSGMAMYLCGSGGH